MLGYRGGFLDRHGGVDFRVTASDTVHLITCCRRMSVCTDGDRNLSPIKCSWMKRTLF